MLWIAISVWNGLVFLLYAADKLAAKRDGHRTPEARLLWFAALAGAPGALLAMRLCRHKTRKPAFRYGVPALLLIQVVAWFAGWRYGLW